MKCTVLTKCRFRDNRTHASLLFVLSCGNKLFLDIIYSPIFYGYEIDHYLFIYLVFNFESFSRNTSEVRILWGFFGKRNRLIITYVISVWCMILAN